MGLQGFSSALSPQDIVVVESMDAGVQLYPSEFKLLHCKLPNFPMPQLPYLQIPEILVVPREKTPTGAAARGNP